MNPLKSLQRLAESGMGVAFLYGYGKLARTLDCSFHEIPVDLAPQWGFPSTVFWGAYYSVPPVLLALFVYALGKFFYERLNRKRWFASRISEIWEHYVEERRMYVTIGGLFIGGVLFIFAYVAPALNITAFSDEALRDIKNIELQGIDVPDEYNQYVGRRQGLISLKQEGRRHYFTIPEDKVVHIEFGDGM